VRVEKNIKNKLLILIFYATTPHKYPSLKDPFSMSQLKGGLYFLTVNGIVTV